jgi:hypothetical protein
MASTRTRARRRTRTKKMQIANLNAGQLPSIKCAQGV